MQHYVTAFKLFAIFHLELVNRFGTGLQDGGRQANGQ